METWKLENFIQLHPSCTVCQISRITKFSDLEWPWTA